MLMDTRQLAAFCAVVERKSFSQAAERLGVTQPAVSMQIRSLEERVGLQLLDRSGRRVEPTEAGLRLYRGAQQLLVDVAGEDDGELRGELAIGAATGPGATVVPVLLCQFQRENPGVRVELTISDTQQVIEDELRKAGKRLRDLDVKLELGLQESVKSAVVAGYGVTFISRTAVESELAAGTLATARVRGLEPSRQISLVRASGRQPTRVAEAFAAFARERV